MKWTRKYGPLAAGCLSLLAVSLVLYSCWTRCSTGVFVDWVESTFMLTWEEYVPSAGTYGIVQHINWHWVKPFLLGVLVVNGLLWAGAVFLTRQLARRKKEQEDVRDIAERLRQALDSDGDASQVFPAPAAGDCRPGGGVEKQAAAPGTGPPAGDRPEKRPDHLPGPRPENPPSPRSSAT